MAANQSAYITRSGRITKRPLLNNSLRLGEKKKLKRAFEMGEAQRADFERRLTELENERVALQTQNEDLRNARIAENQHNRLEIQRLQQELQAARSGVNSRQNQPPAAHVHAQNNQQENVGNVNAAEVCSILGNLNSLQLECKVPKFYDENQQNPLEFLEEIEKYFRIKRINENNKMSTIEVALDGKARLWLNLNNNFESYEQFKQAFIRDFYPIPVQVQSKAKWANTKYKEQDGSFLTFYYRQTKFSNYILPRLSEYEKNYVITQQFPYWVKEALAAVDLQNSNNISSTLTKLDLIHLEKKTYRQQQLANSQSNTQAPQTVRVRHMNVNRGRGRGYYQNNNFDTQYQPFQSQPRFGNISRSFQNNPQTSYADIQYVQLPDTRVPPPDNTTASTPSIVNNGSLISTEGAYPLN